MQSISRKNRSQLLRRILLGAVVLLLVLMLLRFFSWDSEDLAAPLSPPAKPLRNSVYDEAAIRKKVVPLAPALLCAKTVVGKDEAGKDMQALLTTVKGERPDTLARVCEASADANYHQWWLLPARLAELHKKGKRWRRRNEYVLVSFALTMDNEKRRLFRAGQRRSFLRYKGVATEQNGFMGKALFLYLISASPPSSKEWTVGSLELSDNPLVPSVPVTAISTSLFREALTHRDILWITDLHDLPSSSGKKYGEGGKSGWGVEAEVTMSMKLLRGLFYMAHQFPHAQFIQKADDDVFIKLPQLVRDLGRFQGQADAYNNYGLHPYRIPYLYGGIVKFFNSRSGKVSFASGMGEFVNQELLQTIVREASVESDITTPDKRYTFNALIGLCFAPYDSTLANDYRWHHLDHEDVFLGYLVGLVGIGAYTRYENTPVKMKPTSKGFADMIKPNLVQYFRYDLCRAHDYLSGRNIRKTKMRDSVFVHHVLEEEIYLFLLVFFSNPKPFCEKLNAATEADGFDFVELPYTKAVEQYGDFCKTVKDRFPWTEESIFEDLVGGTFRTDALEQWRPLLDLPDPNPDQCEPTGCIPELYQRGPVPFHWWDLFTLYDAAIPREERRLGEKERNQVLPPLFMETTVRCDTVREPADNVN